jgi:subtilisin family serine protease
MPAAQSRSRSCRPAARFRAALVAGTGLALAACGGGGGPGPVTPSAVVPTPAPVPTPTPVTTNFDTAEYRRSTAPVAANAIPAWSSGASGEGVTIGFVDSGIDQASAEFAGRILPQSRDVTGLNRGIQDVEGHGTSIAGVAAAARNDSGIVGLAYNARLAVMRADSGRCDAGCAYTDSAIAAGIQGAAEAGARVISISLGGTPGTPTLRTAFVRAAQAGAVIVISAGNDSAAEVDPLASAAIANAGRAVIVAGAVDSSGILADFSNRAGAAQEQYLATIGVRVRSFDHTGAAFLYSGTSYAAPSVAGAVAVLAQAFPNLTAPQIADILLRSADDAGAPGTDAVYGRGILNLGRALAPAGTTSLAGTAIPVPLDSSGSLGTAFGSGLSTGQSLAAVPVTDSYGRDYLVELGSALRPAAAGRLAGRLQSAALARASTAAAAGGWRLGLELHATGNADAPAADPFRDEDRSVAELGFAQRGMDARAAQRSPLRDTRVVLAYGNAALTLAEGRLATETLPGSAPGGFVADDGLAPDDGTGLEGRRLVMAEARSGALRVAVAASDARLPRPRGEPGSLSQQRITLAGEAARGPMRVAFHLSHGTESGAFLGTRLSPAFGLQGADTLVAGSAFELARSGFGLRLAAAQGWHRPQLASGALLVADGTLPSQSWSVAGWAPLADGRLELRLAQPLAITGGGFRLANGTYVAAAPDARERALELGFSRGAFGVAAFHRAAAGNQRGLEDSGAALSVRTRF